MGIEVDEYDPGLDPAASDAGRWPGEEGSEMGLGVDMCRTGTSEGWGRAR